mgnify:CR=1 FL=1
MKLTKRIELKSGARLHVQTIDPSGISGYRAGGIGIALKQPCVSVIASTADDNLDTGYTEDTRYLHEILSENKFDGKLEGIKIYTKSEIPRHVGLGSGTLHRTLIRIAVSKLLNLDDDIYSLSSLTGVGQYATLKGGLVLVGGVPEYTITPSQVLRGDKGIRVSPNLIGSYKIPRSWKVVLCIPKNPNIHSFSGKEESEFYSKLVPPKISDIHLIAFEILAKLIPSIQYGDFNKFEEALSIITKLGWKKYEKNLHKEYWDITSAAMQEIGARFVGITSGGPTTFTILDSSKCNLENIRLQLETKLNSVSKVVISDVNNNGFYVKKGL